MAVIMLPGSLRLAVALVTLVGCQDELPPVTWKGEVIDFATNDPEAVCGDTLTWTDARAVAMNKIFGETTRERIEYFWVPDLWSDQPWCTAPAAACADDGRIYTQSVPDEHEMVHAIRRNRLPAVFEEGLACVFGDIGWARTPAPRERLLEILESSDPVDFPDYARAGHFVAFLLERDGFERLTQLGAVADYHDDIGDVRTSFEQVYGISLDQALDEYANYPDCIDLAWKDRRIACGGASSVLLEPSLSANAEFMKDVECGQPDVLGPHGGYLITETILDIQPQFDNFPVHLALIGDIDGDVSAAFVSCEGGCSDSTAIWLTPSSFEQPILPAGRYLLRLFRKVDDPGELGISLTF